MATKRGVGVQKKVRGGYGLGVWKAIRRQWPLFNNKLSFVVGNGIRVKFWTDAWCGDTPLCASYKSVFALASSKDAWVGEYWSNQGEGERWNPLFTRPFNLGGGGCRTSSYGYWKICA